MTPAKRKRAKVAPVNGGLCVYCDGKPMKGASSDARFALCELCFAWLAAGNPMPTRGPCSECKGAGTVDCHSCYGDGDRPGGCNDCNSSGDETCRGCRGTGKTTFRQREDADCKESDDDPR